MHPLTLYDVVVLEHQQDTRRRARERTARLRRNDRTTRVARGRAERATSADGPATA